MADLAPGTPEYQEAYDAEIKRLEAGTETQETDKVAAVADQITEETETKAVEESKPSVENELKQLKESLARQEKIAKDNHAAFTRKAQEFAKLQRKLEKEERDRLRPEILDTVPGLEEAIKHVNGPAPQTAGDSWLDTVSRALPDINELLVDKTFFDRVEVLRNTIGEEWNDPVIAIRELSKASAAHLRDQAVSAATDQAKRDFEAKAKKLKAMGMPGGSGKAAIPANDEAVGKYASMSSEDVQKERAKILGY